MKSIYILLTQTGTYICKIIQMVTADQYTHASISFEQELQPLYSFSRRYAYISLPAGLRHEPFDYGFYKKYNDMPCALYELRVTDDVYEAVKSEVETMMTESDRYKFSVLGLLFCRLGIPFHRDYRYFCSEFISEVLQNNDAIELPKDPSLMRPMDYTKLSSLECVFEGPLDELIASMPHLNFRLSNTERRNTYETEKTVCQV